MHSEKGTVMKEGTSNYDLQVDIAKEIFLQYDQAQIIEKYSLVADGDYIYLRYLGTPCRINRETGSIEECRDSVWTECRSFSTVMTVYDLLCYHRGLFAPALLGQWCTVGNFVVTGVTNTLGFTKKYAAKMDGKLEQLRAACVQLGGMEQPVMAGADLTVWFAVTDFFPVLLQFWAGDEEFPPKLLLLWDRNADQFLHFETTFYLQGDLLERLWRRMEERE